MTTQSPGTVQLAELQSASAIFHAVLAETVAAFPEQLQQAQLPQSPQRFRSDYPRILPQFEAARLTRDERAAIARFLTTAVQRRIVWQSETGSMPLDEALAEVGTPLELNVREPNQDPGWRPGMVYRGVRWDASRLADFGAELVRRNIVTPRAGQSLNWVSEHLLDDGVLNLGDRKIVMMGAGAEMAPTRFWLEAGADVLWLDVAPPPADWLDSSPLAGRLFWPDEGADLLTCPQDVLATILAFADSHPVDLGLYAYAPGQARELRLTGSMNAIVNALPAESVASVTMLVSPTTPTELDEHDLAAMHARREARPLWESCLAHLGMLGRGDGSTVVAGAAATRTVVGIQGASYQAAQYLGKLAVAECWARHGVPATDVSRPLRVSANTAAITRTRSLQHPVFAAAFQGAGAFGVETFTPRLSRRLNGLLAVHDWFHPDPPVPGRIRVHGGIHTLPYPLESALRVAATFGLVRSPRLLGGLLRR